ncbi:MAG: hypothetical protein ACI4QD_08180 [Kiritimatiellia bacterium]
MFQGMQSLFTKYWGVKHALLLLFCLLFLPLDASPVGLWVLLSGSLFFATLTLPPIRRGESFPMARERGRAALFADPFVWVAIGLLAYAGFQWYNSGLVLAYQFDTKSWAFGKSPLGWGPFAVKPVVAYRAFVGVLATISAVVAVRHGMPPGGRYGLMVGVSVLTGGAALCFVVQSVMVSFMGISLPVLPLEGGDATSIGAVFTLGALMSCAMVFESAKRIKRRWGFVGMGVVILCQVPIAATLSVAVIVPAVLGVVAAVVIGVGRLRGASANILRFRLLVVLLGGVIGAWVANLSIWCWSPNLMALFARTGWSDVIGAWGEQWVQRAELALSIWQDYPWCGVGPGGYSEFVGFYAKAADWAVIAQTKQLVENGYLRLLVEQGLVGTALLAAAWVVLLATVVARLMSRSLVLKRATKTAVSDRLELSNTPVALWIAVATGAVQMTFCEPLLHPVNLFLWCLALALSAYTVKTGSRALTEKRG